MKRSSLGLLAAASFDRLMFKIFSDAVEEHNTYGFGIFLDSEGTEGGNAHEEIFVEYLSV